MRRRIARVRDAEYDVYGIARVPRSGDPLDNISLDHGMVWAGSLHPFVARENELIAFDSSCSVLEIGRIGRSDWYC